MMGNPAMVFRMGIDAAGFKKGLQDAQKAVTKAKTEAKKAATGKKENPLLENDNKVESKLTGLVQQLAEARNGADATAAAIDRIGDAFNVSLGAGIAIGAVATLIKVLGDAHSAAEKLREEVEALLQPHQRPDFNSIAELEKRIDDIQKKINEVTERGVGGNLWDFLMSKPNSSTENFDAVLEKRLAHVIDLQNRIQEARDDIAAKAAGQTGVMKMEANGNDRGAALEKLRLEYSEKIGAAIREQNSGLMEQLKLQQKLAEDKANKEFDDKEKKGYEERLKGDQEHHKKQKDAQQAAAKFTRDAEKNRGDEIRKASEDAAKREKDAREEKERAEADLNRKKADKQQDEIDEREKDIDEKHERARKQANQRLSLRESAQLSLGELAEEGSGRVRSQAKRALRLEKLARNRALKGNLAGAEEATKRAQAIKDGISTLKDSEKSAAFQTALDNCAVLKEIADNTKGQGKFK